jgi:outer membrane protein assembly factor BamD
MRLRLMAVRYAVATLLLIGCGGGFRPESFPTPEALFAASVQQFEAGNCGAAVRGFAQLTRDLPSRDPRMPEARFYLAECLSDDGDHLGAAREFRRVADEFPDHARAPAALLRAGESLTRMWRRPQLDPTHGETALTVYRELLTRYPSSDAARVAQRRALDLVDRFATKDLRTGDFYFRLRAYDSAILYYRSVIQQWPDSRRAPDALLRLVATYDRLGYDEERRETCEHLRRFYPEHPGLDARCPAPLAP